ncbi:MAG: divalent metal cation transporter [Methanomicrobiaceae archaeon]|uniref:NRAMP family divalent metal transporter n=1 Tax=Methanoculleus sp. TaxID=90427 RepID=UPI00320D14C5|nr:divalent metal cation transporter [Methanomicrobiaceae archaeon]
MLLKDLKKLLGKVGPGFITGAADDDPSGVATYAQTGAIFGYNQLWLVWFTSPFMIVIQQMCGRIGMVTGKGLAGVILDNYPKSVLYVTVSLLVVANTINIGADLGAMASSAQMLLGLPFLFWLALITGSIIALEILVPYKIYSKILKYLALTLFTYVLAAFVVRLDWDEVLYATLIPHIEISAAFLLNIVAILGTTISPYLFFWQASEEVEEEVADGRIPDMGARRPCVTRQGIVEMNRDTVIGMFFSQIIMFFIIVTTAATLHASGITTIQTASQAAEALRPLAGDLSYLLFAAGIIGTGLLAVPVLAGASAYAVAETAGLREGLGKKPGRAPGFYVVIALSALVGTSLDLLGVSPITALYYAATLNGLAAPPLMALVTRIANREDIMGRFVNSRESNILGWVIVLIMALTGAALIVNLAMGL